MGLNDNRDLLEQRTCSGSESRCNRNKRVDNAFGDDFAEKRNSADIRRNWNSVHITSNDFHDMRDPGDSTSPPINNERGNDGHD